MYFCKVQIYRNITFACGIWLFFLLFSTPLTAQHYFKMPTMSLGVGMGVSHYFGDLNPFFDKVAPGYSVNLFSRHIINHYLAWRIQAAFQHMGYDDSYSENVVRRLRNLNFETNIYELSGQIDFHFLRYVPSIRGYNFTPYLTLGLGLFYFNSSTQYRGQKYALRPLQTEGKKYSPVQMSIPVGIGFKWGLNKNLNLGFELSYRFTTTDYLDDVSNVYKGRNSFSDPSAARLQDPSKEQIGIIDRQRGQSRINDNFMSMQLILSVNLYRYYCPQAILF